MTALQTRLRGLLRFLPALFFTALPLRAETVVHLGEVRQFTGPADANLDLTGIFEYAINFSADDPAHTVSGLTFRPDTQAIPGATLTGPQNVAPWQAKPEYGDSADDEALEELMHDIRWANSGTGEKLQARLAVTPGIRYKMQILISGNGEENRAWDIRLNGQPAVDEITSLGARPGAGYAVDRSTVWVCEFVANTDAVTVEMGDFFGGNDGGDRNPIWQALTLERVHIPSVPEDLTLSSTLFFPGQTAPVGAFTVTDGKFGATHALTLVPGPGSGDNAKFTLSGGQLLPAPFDFSAQAPGGEYHIRARAADAEDAARSLEKTFTLSLAAPHPPAAVTLNVTSLSAGLAPGQTAGLLSASDPDSFDRHEFLLVPGVGDAHNAFFSVAGKELRVAAAPPAGLEAVSLRLRAVDLSGLAVETALPLPLVNPRVRINEALAVPVKGSPPRDRNGESRDWIELYNEQAQPVNLEGWRLTDDPAIPDKWTFPAAVIPPNGYLLIFAGGAGAGSASVPLRANFSLSQEGERLLLSRPDGLVLSDVTLPAAYPGVAWGTGGSAGNEGYLLTPTPGAENSRLAAAGANTVFFSEAHGFRTEPFSLTLTAALPGSVIRYTLDGSVPRATSPVYSGPLAITPVAGTARSGVRIVRAMAEHPDAAWAPVTTQTWLFVNGVNDPRMDGIPAQTNFINSIRNHAVYGPLLDDAFLSLPAVSLVINNSSGLPLAETESSLELFDPQGAEPGFTIPAGVIRSGTSSLNYPKGSMSARFRGEYGASALHYPVYAVHPHDTQGAATEFQELRLRSCSHDSLSWLGSAENPSIPYGSPPVTRGGDAQFVRNIWIEDMQLLMGQPGKHGRMVNMFVNGNYYGLYHIQEHDDDDYMGSYYPGGSEDYHFTGEGTTGSDHDGESWRTVWAKVKASLGNYTEARRWVDVVNLADYMILTFYGGNDWDWSTLHNWGAAGPRLPDQGGWKFFSQDQDVSLQDVRADNTDQTAPDNLFHSLMRHADFKVLFRDRAYRHLFHDGVLTPEKAARYYELRANEIHKAIVAETARWQPSSSVGPLPWDRDGEWTVEYNYLMNTFFPQRAGRLLSQLRARGWYPLDAPEMSVHGGIVDPGTEVRLTGPRDAAIYYTLDGSDPRLPGGAVNPSALSHTGGVTTKVVVEGHDGIAGRGAVWKYLAPATDPGTAWREAAHDDSAWPSGPSELGYGDGDEVTVVGVADTDPATPGIQGNLTTYFRHVFQVDNPAAVTGVNIRLKRDDGAVVYLNGREVFRSAMPGGEIGFTTPGNGGVNVSDDGGVWLSRTLIPAEYTLNAGPNTIAVEVHNAASFSSDITFDLELGLQRPASSQAVVINGSAVLKTRALKGTEWSALNEAAFLPSGAVPANAENVIISEIHYHPSGEGLGDAEFVEFLNPSAQPVDLSGAGLRGGVTFTFPPGSVLSPGERLVAVKDTALFDARYRDPASPWYHPGIRVAGTWTGSLSNSGEGLTLTSGGDETLFSLAWEDGGAWSGRSDGKGSSLELKNAAAAPGTTPEKSAWLSAPENWRPSSEVHGTPGRAGAGPDDRIAINEVLPEPLPPDVSFIELHNRGPESVSLEGWLITDSLDTPGKYRFPAGSSLASGAWMTITGERFGNPADPGTLVPFSLSGAGGSVWLIEADAAGHPLRFVDRFEFTAIPAGMAAGLVPGDGGSPALLRRPTAGAANAAELPGYGAWIHDGMPSSAGLAEMALTADPDGDGLSNLLEFALNLRPWTGDSSPVALRPAPGAGEPEIHFSIRNDIPGLTATIEVSSDLSVWDRSEANVERASEPTSPEGNTTTIIARLRALPGEGRKYVRVSISF